MLVLGLTRLGTGERLGKLREKMEERGLCKKKRLHSNFFQGERRVASTGPCSDDPVVATRQNVSVEQTG